MSPRGQRSRRSTMYRRVGWCLVATAAVCVVVGVVVAFRLLGVQRDLREARDLLETAGRQVENGELAAARDGLAQAERLLVRSNGRLYNSPELDIVSWVPVIGENIEALRDTVGLAFELVSGGGRILALSAPLEDAAGQLQVPLREGVIPLDTVGDIQFEVVALARSLPSRQEEPSGSRLVGQVADAQERVFEEAVRRRDQLTAVGQGLTLLNEMAGGDGPRRYLIAVANTAEMRGSGGMILSYGVLEGAGGDFVLPAFGNIDELFLDDGVDPAALGLAADEQARWDGLEPTRLWRNVNLVPDVEVLLPRMAAMYEAATGQGIDGVIQVDAHGLAAILEGVGPVQVDGVGEVNAQNAVDLTLNHAYTLFPDRDQRQEVLGDVAEATFRRLVDGEYDSLRPLGEAVLRAAGERHIILQSARFDADAPAGFFGADGALPEPDRVDHALLTVQNFSRNKLDYFIDTSVTVTGRRPVGQLADVDIAVTVTNTAPPGEDDPAYVFGDGTFAEPGLYLGAVSLYLPTGTALLGGSGNAVASPTLTTEGGRTVLGFDVEVPAGGSAAVTVQLRLPPRPPDEPYRFDLVPVPRVRPTVWNVDLDLADGVRVSRTGPLLVAESLTAPSR